VAQSSLFERVTSALFGGARGSVQDKADERLIADMIELVVEAVEPRIRHRARYRQQLKVASGRASPTFARSAAGRWNRSCSRARHGPATRE
jgi:hypothetical protein